MKIYTRRHFRVKSVHIETDEFSKENALAVCEQCWPDTDHVSVWPEGRHEAGFHLNGDSIRRVKSCLETIPYLACNSVYHEYDKHPVSSDYCNAHRPPEPCIECAVKKRLEQPTGYRKSGSVGEAMDEWWASLPDYAQQAIKDYIVWCSEQPYN